jgi:hypothetical protein
MRFDLQSSQSVLRGVPSDVEKSKLNCHLQLLTTACTTKALVSIPLQIEG